MSEAAAPSEDAPNQMARDAEKTGGGDAASPVSVANFNADTVREQILKHLRGADLDQTTTRSVREHLVATYGYDLEHPDNDAIFREELAKALRIVAEENEAKEKAEEGEKTESNGTAKKGESSTKDEGGLGAEAEAQEEAASESERDESDGEEEKKKKTSKNKRKKPASSPSTSSGTSTKRGRFGPPQSELQSRTSNVFSIAPELEAVIGVKKESRLGASKLLWSYIRENGLLAKGNKILLDEKLKKLFGEAEFITESQLNKGLANFLLRPDGKPVSTKPTKRKREKATGGEEGEEGEGEGEGGEEPKKKKKGGFHKPMQLSSALATFVGKETMSRPELVKFITAYVKEKNLKDPKDGRVILFDEKLQEVFGTKKTTFFKINRLLNNHVAPLEQ